MTEKYKFLYQEETDKLTQNITISSTMNQSISNFLVIQTFITGFCFYLSKHYLNYLNTDAWYVCVLVLWSIGCLLDIIILCFLIWNLFSTPYALPLFKEPYSNNLMQFIDNGGNIDLIYRDWYKVYRRINFLINFFREGKIHLFRMLKILAILSFVVLSISSLGLGFYIHNSKEEAKNMCPENKNDQQQNQEETENTESTATEQQPPTAQDQIVLITAAEKLDLKKAVEKHNDTLTENKKDN